MPCAVQLRNGLWLSRVLRVNWQHGSEDELENLEHSFVLEEPFG